MFKSFVFLILFVMTSVYGTIFFSGGKNFFFVYSYSAPFSFVSSAPDPDERVLKLDIVKKQSLSMPNPFYISRGSADYPTLYYWLDEAQDITISVYSSFGQMIGSEQISQNSEHSKPGINLFEISPSTTSFSFIRPGVYFYLIYQTSDHKVLHKGKIGVQP